MRRAITLGALFALLAASPGLGEEEPAIPLYETLGTFGRTITTSADRAQQYFDQGMRLAYAFGRTEAIQSFQEAQKSDPECAMCYWGEAWARGPYQNDKMGRAHWDKAYGAIQEALARADGAPENERALIEAMAVRYVEEHGEEREDLDRAYLDAMRDVVRRFPDDQDAATLLAEAYIVLHPWDLYPDGGDQPRPEAVDAIAALEGVLAANLRHPGACHLYIHSVEPSNDPGRAEACADVLSAVIPGASHIQHMPSHIYMRIGRYADGVRANQQAHIVDLEAEEGRSVAIYSMHNLDMLTFAAWMDGQSFVALQSARDFARGFPLSSMLPLMLVRFGRWEEVFELEAARGDDRADGLRHFSQGMAHLRLGRPRKAERSLSRLDRVIAGVPEPEDPDQRFKLSDLLTVGRHLLEGEILAAAGDTEAAVAALEAAIEVEDALPYSEPERWPLPARQFLGALLLDAGRPADAERVYRAELDDHPENGWSLFGLEQSLAAQGRGDEARGVAERFRRVWARSDLRLTASRY